MVATVARSQRAKLRPDEGSALLKVGDLLAGKYRVERILGEGGMGVVVAAHHELLDQHVAVKLLYTDIADREAQSRLLLEARACAKLQSEHVARVVDVDTGADGLPFIVMELLEGADLCQIADQRGALPRWLVVDYVLQALEGLAHAHSRSIVHRDLKPSNLFLSNRPDGSQIIKILDFGISKTTDSNGTTGERKKAMQLTGGRAVLGSPPYMSPEQVRSPKTVDARTDIWALGIVMYELLTNSMPFGGDEMNETFAQILEKEPQPIRAIVNGVPEGLEHVVMKCLAKNRDQRFADVGELAQALVPFGSGTWIGSADRVIATMARIEAEAHSGPRIKGAANTNDRSIIPSSPGGKRLDPELVGTSSTVARLGSLGSRGRSLLALSGVITVVAVGVFLGVWLHQRSAAPAVHASADPVDSAAGEPPPPAPSAVAIPMGAATSVVTSMPHQAENANEGAPEAQSNVLGASPVNVTALPSAAKHPPPRTAPPPRKTAPPPANTGLPSGLPRSRDGK